MKVMTRVIFLNDDDEKFFGEGPCRLLRALEETGSLHAGANQLGMAYSKAMRILKNAEDSLGFPLTVRTVGGKAGGGSTLTDKGKAWLERYEAYRDACFQINRKLYEEYFHE